MRELFAADGLADGVDWQLHSAIRGPSSAYSCPDEDFGCPYTLWTECAMDTAFTMSQRIAFITCWDESNTRTLSKRAESCSSEANLDFSLVSNCQSGSKGKDLLASAKAWFTTRFPEHATSGPYHVPHIYVADVEQDLTDYDSLLSALCSGGLSAKACGAAEIV